MFALLILLQMLPHLEVYGQGFVELNKQCHLHREMDSSPGTTFFFLMAHVVDVWTEDSNLRRCLCSSLKQPSTHLLCVLLCERGVWGRPILTKGPNPDVFLWLNHFLRSAQWHCVEKLYCSKYHCHAPLVHTFIGQNECKHTGHQGNLFTCFYRSTQINKSCIEYSR